MKQAAIRIRISSSARDKVRKDPNKNLSSVLRVAMEKYVSGKKDLPEKVSDVVPTSAFLDLDLVNQFETLAKSKGYSFDAAVRLALDSELEETG